MELSGKREAALFPASFACEGFLLTTRVDAGRVNLVVASLLEAIETTLEFAYVCDPRSRRRIRTKGHQTEDDAVPRV